MDLGLGVSVSRYGAFVAGEGGGGTVAPTGNPYDLNLAAGSYSGPSGAIANPFASELTFARTGVAYARNAAGAYSSFATGVPRITDLGLLLETEARTNGTKNNSMTGGVNGSPGSLPTTWTESVALPAGITKTVTFDTDPVLSLPRMRISLVGTPSASPVYTLQFGANAGQAVTPGLNYVSSAWIYYTDVTTLPLAQLANLIQPFINGSNVGQTVLTRSVVNRGGKLLPRDTTPKRLMTQGEVAPAAAAFIKPALTIQFQSGVPVSFEIAIVAPQTEAITNIEDGPSSPIMTTTVAVTRNAESLALSGGLLAHIQGTDATVEMWTDRMRRGAVARPLLTVNTTLDRLKRGTQGEILSNLGPSTYRSPRSNFEEMQQRHAVQWSASGLARVASQSAAEVKQASASPPAVTSAVLGCDGYIARLRTYNGWVSDLSAYNSLAADLVVYGATSGGVTAAGQAAALGRSVRILGGWREVQPGGMSTGGLYQIDASDITAFGGMSADWQAYFKEYQKSPSVGATWESSLAYFDYLVRKYKIPMHWTKGVVSAVKNGATKRLTSATMTNGGTFAASRWIDASYEGDLMAAAAVTYRVGREAKDTSTDALGVQRNPYNGNLGTQPGSSMASGMGEQQFDNKAGGVQAIDPFITAATPASGYAYGVFETRTVSASFGAADDAIQAYNFRMTLTTVAANKATLVTNGAPPPGYAASNYELLGRYLAAMTALGKTVVGFATTASNSQMGLSDHLLVNGSANQYDINSRGALSTDGFGMNHGVGWAALMTANGVASPSANYAVATYAEREIYWKWQENWQRGLFYWLAYSGDSRIPAQYATDAANFGLLLNSYIEPHENDTANWMMQLYVREARALRGIAILESSDVKGTDGATPVKGANVIATGSYGIDSHHAGRYAVSRSGAWYTECEGNLFDSPSSPNKVFPILMEYVMPVRGECTNLLVTFAASAMHTGFGALRMELAHMAMSQSAAFICDQTIGAADQDVQDVVYATLRTSLLAAGQVVTQTN